MLHLKGYLWILYFILGVYVLLLLLEWIHFVYKRIHLYIRLKKTGAEIRGLHPLWLLCSRSHKADFLMRAKNGVTYAVRFVECWKRGTEYAIPSADRWYYAHHILLPGRGAPQPIHLGFRRKINGMDFRWWLEREKIDAVPLWLCYPRPYRVVDRVYDPAKEERKAHQYELLTGADVDGIRLVDGSVIVGLLTRDTPDF